jgi:phenylalanyl-tRNA synthetase alpha chain
MQDSLFIQTNQILLRTHTSSVSALHGKTTKPPLRTISLQEEPATKPFRRGSLIRIFHQVEGLYIDKDVSFADLKQTCYISLKEMFENSKSAPKLLPFTEPCRNRYLLALKTETDYRITKGTGWLEIGGCGMVDPNVLKKLWNQSRRIRDQAEWELNASQCHSIKLAISECFMKTM